MSIVTLTKQAQKIVGSDVPPDGGAGAPGITPSMIDAGVEVLRGANLDFDDEGAIVRDVFEAMVAEAEKSSLEASAGQRLVPQSRWWQS